MKIYVFSNFKDDSRNALRELTSLLDEFGFEMLDESSEEADVLACIGPAAVALTGKPENPAAAAVSLDNRHQPTMLSICTAV